MKISEVDMLPQKYLKKELTIRRKWQMNCFVITSKFKTSLPVNSGVTQDATYIDVYAPPPDGLNFSWKSSFIYR